MDFDCCSVLNRKKGIKLPKAESKKITEPSSKKKIYPDIILIPLVAFDNNLNRLGYGGGYYDRVIEKLNRIKKILKIGLAFSVQKINNVPITRYDKKLDYVVTDKYIL